MAVCLNDEIVRLRAVEPSDAQILYTVENSDFGLSDSCWFAPLSYQSVLTYAMSYDADPFASGGIRLTVERVADSAPVGFIDLYDLDSFKSHAFISIFILERFRHNGFGLRAVSLMMKYAFRVLALHQIAAKIEVNNIASQRLFEKAGFTCNSILNDWLFDPDKRVFTDMMIYQNLFSPD